MRTRDFVVFCSACIMAMVASSCDSAFMQGMAAGMTGFGGMPYGAGIGAVPYGLRPDVYAAHAAKQAYATVQAQQEEVQKNIRNHPVVVDPKSTTPIVSSSAASSSGGSSTYSSSSQKQHSCYECGGTGSVVKETYTGTDKTKWCDTCKKNVSFGHYHTTCTSCRGKGSW